MDHKQFIAARESHKKVLGKRLMTEAFIDVVEDNPELMFDYNKLAANVAAYKLDKARAKPDCTGFIPNTWGLVLPIRSEKKKHFWFWSD